MKKDIKSVLGLYPTPLVVVGTKDQDRVNWVLVGHVGIMGHDHLVISLSKAHFSNQAIKKTGVLSVNIVDEKMLSKADYTGTVSGAKEDKSKVFDYSEGSLNTPLIDMSPLSMECCVEDNYETKGFDNFIVSVKHTYVDQQYLNEDDQINYSKLKPVLFAMPGYQYLLTGKVLGPCMKMHDH